MAPMCRFRPRGRGRRPAAVDATRIPRHREVETGRRWAAGSRGLAADSSWASPNRKVRLSHPEGVTGLIHRQLRPLRELCSNQPADERIVNLH